MEVLSKRERQIMDILYQRGSATAAEVMEGLPDPPSYSAVRSLLSILERKNVVKHHREGLRYVFTPLEEKSTARVSALQKLLQTFFHNSVEEAVSAMLDLDEGSLDAQDYDRLMEMIKKAKSGKAQE